MNSHSSDRFWGPFPPNRIVIPTGARSGGTCGFSAGSHATLYLPGLFLCDLAEKPVHRRCRLAALHGFAQLLYVVVTRRWIDRVCNKVSRTQCSFGEPGTRVTWILSCDVNPLV
jgi:hypothetical protein